MLMKLRAMFKNQKGFTLIELLVVISIIGVLSAVAIPKFMDSAATARTAKVQTDLSAIDSAISLYSIANNGGIPLYNVNTLGKYFTNGILPKVSAGSYKIGTAAAANATPVYNITNTPNGGAQAYVQINGTAYSVTGGTNTTALKTF